MEHLKDLLLTICNEHKIKLRCYEVEWSPCVGMAYPLHEEIHLFFTETRTENMMLSAFFHELAHIMCARSNVYPAYHGRYGIEKHIKASNTHGIQAELYVDKLGKELAKVYLPKFKWHNSYTTEYEKDVIRNRYKGE